MHTTHHLSSPPRQLFPRFVAIGPHETLSPATCIKGKKPLRRSEPSPHALCGHLPLAVAIAGGVVGNYGGVEQEVVELIREELTGSSTAGEIPIAGRRCTIRFYSSWCVVGPAITTQKLQTMRVGHVVVPFCS